MRWLLAVAPAALVFPGNVSAQAPPLIPDKAQRREVRRDDIDAFHALLARGAQPGRRCALPDGTTRPLHTTVTFRLGQVYRCVEVWARIPSRTDTPRQGVFERRVTWTNVPDFRLLLVENSGRTESWFTSVGSVTVQ